MYDLLVDKSYINQYLKIIIDYRPTVSTMIYF